MPSLTNSRATTVASEFDQQKVATYNGALQVLDSLEAGKLSVSITTADVTLTGTPAAPQAQNKYFELSGTLTGNRSLIFPVNDDDPATGNPRLIVVKNGTGGAFTVTVKVSGQTGVTVTQGTTAILLHNGTDFVKLFEAATATGAINGPPIWARAYHDANQSISNTTLTALSLNQERYDTDTIHDTSTNNSRLTCKTAGVYVITGGVTFDNNATGIRNAQIRLNGSDIIGHGQQNASGGSDVSVVITATIYRLAVNDYVELMGYQNSGGSLNSISSSNTYGSQYKFSPEFSMVRVGS